MHKILIVFFYIGCNFSQCLAQHFEWASAGGNLSAGFRGSAIDKKGNIIVVGYAFQPENFHYGDSWLYSSAGDQVSIKAYQRPMLVISYDNHGKISWLRQIDGGGEPVGVIVNHKDEITVLSKSDNHRGAFFPELSATVGSSQYFLLTLDGLGNSKHVVSDSTGSIRDPLQFHLSPDDDFVVTGRRVIDSVIDGRHTQIGSTYIAKIDRHFKLKWRQHIFGHGPSPTCASDIAPNGDIYIAGAYNDQITFQDGKTYPARVLKGQSTLTKPFEGYFACYGTNGKLKFVKRSGGKSIFSSLKVSGQQVLAGARIVDNSDFFGGNPDTTGKKEMVLAAFTRGGDLLWTKTSPAHTITAISTDKEDNIYAIVNSKLSNTVYEKDTLRNTYESLIIASYTADGTFRWVKNCRLPMSTNEVPQLRTDECGNIFISGVMWSVMKAQLRWFDATFVKGDGYGEGAFIAKLKNTMQRTTPDILDQKKSICIISPAPWTMNVYPNPFQDRATVTFKLTYADTRVSMFLYDLNGRLVKTVFENVSYNKGSHSKTISSGTLPKAVYILVIKGSETVATETVVIL